MSMSPVRQPLQILRKDVIHLWPETLVSVLLLVAFAWADAQSWQPAPSGEINPAALGAALLRFLIPVSWLVLTSRLVHDEELVGDRQFWTTRPYTWFGLLSAKVLYLLVFIGVPFVVMQAWLLHHAGMYPTHTLTGLGCDVLFMALVFLLPLLAIAAVTATFIRFALSVLVGVMYVFVIVAVAAYNWADRLDAPYLNYVLLTVCIAVPVAAIMLQYVRRRTLITRLMLLGLPLLFVLIAVLAPTDLLTNMRYPDKKIGQIDYNPAFEHSLDEGRIASVQGKVEVNVPVNVTLTGLLDKAYVEVQRVRVTLDGPGGYHYASGWTSTRSFFSQDRKLGAVSFTLPEKVFNDMHGKSVALHLALGIQTIHPGTPYTIKANEALFPVPGNGACKVAADTGGLECRYPFSVKEPTQVKATIHSGDCLNPGPQTADAYAAISPSPFPYGFNPVEIAHPELSLGQQKVGLCAGDTVTFTPPSPETTSACRRTSPRCRWTRMCCAFRCARPGRHSRSG